MQISNIKESGSNNILMWAIANGADIKDDQQLQAIINDELFYLVTMNDVNFFELFRLTQMYRDKVRIIDEKKAEMPTRSELHKLFQGSFVPNKDKPDEEVQYCELVEHCGNMFINLAMQMTGDDDIITPSAVRMFLPMISRKFNVQIPVSFIDLINSMSVDETNEIYNTSYPVTLQTILDTEVHGVKTTLQMAFIKGTSIIKYNKQYDQYLKAIKYSPLKTCNNNKLYKISMLGFSKYDTISRGDVRINLFNPNKETMGTTLKRMAHLNTPLELDFVIQLPIQYMQMLENFFNPDVLQIAYESSMSNIIDGGLIYDDFITSEYIEDTEDEDERIKLEEHNNAIEAYRVRITDANKTMLNAMPILLNANTDIDITSVFAMMPSIYSTKAVIRINITNANKLLGHYDPMINEMFNDAINIANSVIGDINRAN